MWEFAGRAVWAVDFVSARCAPPCISGRPTGRRPKASLSADVVLIKLGVRSDVGRLPLSGVPLDDCMSVPGGVRDNEGFQEVWKDLGGMDGEAPALPPGVVAYVMAGKLLWNEACESTLVWC